MLLSSGTLTTTTGGRTQVTASAAVKLALLLLIYLLVIVLVWLILFDGVAANIVYNPKPHIIRSSANHDVAFVYLTGTQSSGSAHAAPMIGVWQEHADVVVVVYNRYRFDGPAIVSAVYQQLRTWDYRKV